MFLFVPRGLAVCCRRRLYTSVLG